MGSKQSSASLFERTSSLTSGAAREPKPCVIDSTPAPKERKVRYMREMGREERGYSPMPMSIWPARIWLAIWLTAVSPEEHWRLMVLMEVSTGMPACSAAMRAAEAPPPGGRTLPTEISSMSLGSRLILE